MMTFYDDFALTFAYFMIVCEFGIKGFLIFLKKIIFDNPGILNVRRLGLRQIGVLPNSLQQRRDNKYNAQQQDQV